jgi:hypothetical protein
MTATLSRPAHTWAATHRLLLALVAFAVALAATVAIVLMTAGSSPAPSIQAPDQGQTHTQNQIPTGARNQGPADPQPRCLQYMGVRPC